MRKRHSSANPLGSIPADRASRVATIVDDVMRRSDAGDAVDFDEICRSHGDLMPELGDRLRSLRLLLSAERIAQAPASRAEPTGAGEITPAERSWLESGIPGYEICRRIERGGQGTVYLAKQRSTDRYVAIKVLTDGPVANRGQLRRFDREVELLLRLQHPNIVAVFDKGVVNDRPYFVMEYVEGVTITDYAVLHSLSAMDRVRLFVRVVRAISDAHQKLVIHRDLKPSNILVDQQGTPRVLDFGLGKAIDEWSASADQSAVSLLGQVVGTLPYLSPEQAGGIDDIDVLSDVYSLGVVLFELLTGRHPIDTSGDRRAATNRILMDRPRRLRECLGDGDWNGFCRPGEIGDDLEAIVAMALAKDRAVRYQSAAALAEDLKRYLAGEAIQARSNQGYYQLRMALRRHRKVVAVAAAFAAVVTASLVTVAYFWLESRSERNNAQIASRIAQETLYQVASEVDEIIMPIAGGIEARNRILSRVAGNLDRLTESVEHDASMGDLYALVQEKRGDIALAEGRRADAQEHFEAFRASTARALSDGALNDEVLARLVRAHSKMAQVTDDADQHHDQAVRLARQLLSQGARSSDDALTLYQALVARGEYLMHVGRYANAAECLEEVLSAFQEEPDAGWPDPSFALTAALAFKWNGEAQHYLGDGERSLHCLTQSVQMLEQLVAGRPFDVRMRSELIFAYEKLGDYYQSDGRYKEALEVFGKAEADSVALCAMEPTVAEWRRHLVTARYRLGQGYVNVKELDQAAAWADRAFAAVTFDGQGDSETHELTSELAYCHLLRGRVLANQKQYELAEKELRECLKLRQQLVEAHPEDDNAQESLAMTFGYLGQSLRQQNRHSEAYDAYKEALDIRLELLERGGDVTARTLAVASSYMKLAVWHLDQRTPEHDLAAIPEMNRAEAILINLRDSGKLIGRSGDLKLWLDSIEDNRRLIERRSKRRESAAATPAPSVRAEPAATAVVSGNGR